MELAARRRSDCLTSAAHTAARHGSLETACPTRAARWTSRRASIVTTLPLALQPQPRWLDWPEQVDLAYSTAEEGGGRARHRPGMGYQLEPRRTREVEALRGAEQWCRRASRSASACWGQRRDVGQEPHRVGPGAAHPAAEGPAEALERLLVPISKRAPRVQCGMVLGLPNAVEATVRADRVDAGRPTTSSGSGLGTTLPDTRTPRTARPLPRTRR